MVTAERGAIRWTKDTELAGVQRPALSPSWTFLPSASHFPPSFFSPLTPRRHFTLNIQPNSRTEGRTGRFSIDFLIYSALRKERSVSSFQARGREREGRFGDTTVRVVAHAAAAVPPHGWKTPTHCSNMPFARDRTNEQNEACLL